MSQELLHRIAEQKEALAALEREAEKLIHSDAARENAALKAQAEKLQRELLTSQEETARLSAMNKDLKNALFEQIYSEKLQLVSKAFRKADIYFQSGVRDELNRLTALENELRTRFEAMRRSFADERLAAGTDLLQKVNALERETSETLTRARLHIAQDAGALAKDSREGFDALRTEPVTEEIVEAVGKKNNLEAFVGGNLINKLGILFVVLGIIAVSRFTVEYLSDALKAVIMFLASAGFLAAGEWMNRRRPSAFSLGLTSIGVAGMYAALSVSYFMLHVIGMLPAIALCVLITAAAFYLSRRYNSQTIAAFALFGGYIPIVSAGEGIAMVYACMVYFVVLNVLALLFSHRRKWKIVMFLGFALNLLGASLLVFGFVPSDVAVAPDMLGFRVASLCFLAFSFAVYTAIPVLANLRGKHTFDRASVAMLCLNTVFACGMIFGAVYFLGMGEYDGVTAVVFAVVYLLLGALVYKLFPKEKDIHALFRITGTSFTVLAIPLQLGKAWVTLGWLAEAVLLATYGIVRDSKFMRRAGYIIGGLCLATFFYIDAVFFRDALFVYKYFAVTLGALVVFGAFHYRGISSAVGERVYNTAVLVNTWLFCLYIVTKAKGWLSFDGFDTEVWIQTAQICITFGFALGLPQIPFLRNRCTKRLAACFSAAGMLWLLVALHTARPLAAHSALLGDGVPVSAFVAVTLVLVAVSALAILALRGLLLYFASERGMAGEWLPFGLSAYFLLLLTQSLVTQYGIAITSMVISLIYIVMAFAWIVYGFVRRFAFMRRFGLGLAVLAVAKLFLVDLPDLTEGYKMLSYFAFGITLLAISYVYQRFSRAIGKAEEKAAPTAQTTAETLAASPAAAPVQPEDESEG